LIPPYIHCPKCSGQLKLEEIRDPLEKEHFSKAGYSQGARGKCPCGVVAVFCVKPLPENPTFTLLFNVYKVEEAK